MSIDLPVQSDPNNLGGPAKLNPGKYHVLLTNWREYGGKGGESHVAEFEVLAAEPANQEFVNATHSEYFRCGPPMGKPDSTNWADRLMKLAICLGLTTADELNSYKKAGERVDLEFAHGEGKSLFILIEHNHYNDRLYVRIADWGLAMYPLDHPKCSAWPRNESYARRIETNASPVEKDSDGTGTSDSGFFD